MQLAKWPSSRVLTSVLTPSQVDRNRVTSFMHSLNPALYFPRTVGSVFRAAVGKWRHSIRCLNMKQPYAGFILFWTSIWKYARTGDLPVICARCMFLRCFTVISRMSAFSSLECLELCVKIRVWLRHVLLWSDTWTLTHFGKTRSQIWSTYIFFQSIQDERFQLSQAFVDSCSSSFLHNGFRRLKSKRNTRQNAFRIQAL